MEGRETDTTLVRCSDCGWEGRVMDCEHSYSPIFLANGEPDIEPVDYCPYCGSDQLEHPETEELILA